MKYPKTYTTKNLYFESPHIEWLPFAEEMGWDATSSKIKYPVTEWVAEKKDKLAQAALERVSDVLFSQNGSYHREVLKTLCDLPKFCDQIQGLLKKKLDSLTLEIATNNNSVSISDIQKLANATKSLIEAKHKALLIDRWEISHTEAFLKGNQEISTGSNSQDFMVEIIGENGQPVRKTSQDFVEMITSWYDKPVLPHVEAEGISGQ